MKNKVLALGWFAGLGLLAAAMAFFEQQKNLTAYYVVLAVIGYYLASGGILLKIRCKNQTLFQKILLWLFIVLTFLGSSMMMVILAMQIFKVIE